MPEEYFAINHSMSRRTPSTMDSAGILAEVVALDGAKGTIALGTGTWRIDLATVTPANVLLAPEPGAMLTKYGSGTLTVDGSFRAPPLKFFFGFSDEDVLFTGPVEVNARWFGSDAAAIQSAILSTLNVNAPGQVYAPAGTYSGASITIPDNFQFLGLRFRGDGPDKTKIVLNPTTPSHGFNLSYTTGFWSYATAFELRDFALSTSSTAMLDLLRLGAPNLAIVDNVRSTGNYVPQWAAGTSYSATAPDRVTNDTGKVYECITTGVSAGSGGPTGTGGDITDGTVHWRYIGKSTAMKIAGAMNTTIRRCRIENGASAGLQVGELGMQVGTSTRVLETYVGGSARLAGPGINIENATTTLISGGTVESNYGGGIWIGTDPEDPGSGAEITHVHFEGNRGSCLRVGGVDDAHPSGCYSSANTFLHNQATGLTLFDLGAVSQFTSHHDYPRAGVGNTLFRVNRGGASTKYVEFRPDADWNNDGGAFENEAPVGLNGVKPSPFSGPMAFSGAERLMQWPTTDGQYVGASGELRVNQNASDIQSFVLTRNSYAALPTTGVMPGTTMRFRLYQDAVGGRTMQFINSPVTHSWVDSGNVANAQASIEFEYDGAAWLQTRVTGWNCFAPDELTAREFISSATDSQTALQLIQGAVIRFAATGAGELANQWIQSQGTYLQTAAAFRFLNNMLLAQGKMLYEPATGNPLLSVSADGTGVSLGSSAVGAKIGFFAGTGSAKPTITGSKGGNAALASLLAALADLGLVVDSTT